MSKEKPIKAAGYIRVSTAEQVENESLTIQSEAIKQYCKANGYELTEIYADKGISGGTVKERHDLQRAMHDAQRGKFDMLIVHRLSRFGRNAQELLNNHEELTNAGIELCSIKEGIDFTNAYGKAMLTMLAAIAELEREIINEQMLESRVELAKKGLPFGRPPFGRKFDKKKGKWVPVENEKEAIQWAADEYLNGGSIEDIVRELEPRYKIKMSSVNLRRIFKKRSGDKIIVNFEGEDPIPYPLPRLLEDDTIQDIKDRLVHNRTDNRTDVTNKYVLTGFVRCEKCHSSLSGATLKVSGKEYKYYRHRRGKYEECNAFNSVRLEKLEHAVFQTIFENMHDVPTFEKAIKGSLPDTDHIEKLENKIETKKERRKKVNDGLERLMSTVVAGPFDMEDIKEKADKLKQTKEQLTNEIEDLENQRDNLPDPEEVKQEAHYIRTQFKRKYQSKEHLQNMSFDDKKRLLHFLFDGKAPNGDHYGIYVMKKGSRSSPEIDYFMFGRLTGLRTIKGNDINYTDHLDDNSSDDNDNGSNGSSGGNDNSEIAPRYYDDQYVEVNGVKRLKKRAFPIDKKDDSSHRYSFFKTNKSSFEIFMQLNTIKKLS